MQRIVLLILLYEKRKTEKGEGRRERRKGERINQARMSGIL